MTIPRAPSRTGPRTEWKILLEPARADELFAIARQRLAPDPHVEDAESCGYRVESVYLDTPELACFERSDRLPKYRVRRYGSPDSRVFLEEKLRRAASVWKRRIPIDADHVAALLDGGAGLGEAALWYRSKIRLLRLRPTLLVVYDRQALVGEGDVRLTIDRAVHAAPVATSDLRFAPAGPARPVLDQCVLEIKFPGAPSALVHELLDLLGIEPVACSKYRLGVLAFRGDLLSNNR